MTESKNDYFIGGFKCEPKDDGMDVETIKEKDVRPDPVEPTVYLSLYCPADAPQNGDFVVLYQPKNGEEWERTLTASDYTADPDKSQTLLYRFSQPVNAETGKMSVWFRGSSPGYTFTSYGNLSRNGYKETIHSGNTYITFNSVFEFVQHIAIIDSKDYFVMGFGCEQKGGDFSIQKISEQDTWPELTEEQAGCLREAVKSMLREAHDAIDDILADENLFEFSFNETRLPAYLFTDEISLTLGLRSSEENIRFWCIIKTAPDTEIRQTLKVIEVSKAKDTLASTEFAEEATTLIKKHIRKILKDRQ